MAREGSCAASKLNLGKVGRIREASLLGFSFCSVQPAKQVLLFPFYRLENGGTEN